MKMGKSRAGVAGAIANASMGTVKKKMGMNISKSKTKIGNEHIESGGEHEHENQ